MAGRKKGKKDSMKLTPLTRAALLALAFAATLVSLHAQPVTNSGFTATSVFSSADSNNIVSFDWDSSNNLYYLTATPSFNLGGFYAASSSTPILAGGSSTFSGASVVSIGSYVYFNDSDLSGNQNIYAYGPTGGSLGLSLVSNVANYGLFGHNGDLYITGAPSPNFTNVISHSTLQSNGTLTPGSLATIEQDSASPGPLAFDSVGNLYYAPGDFDTSIYKWTAAQVAAALLSPGTSPLTTSNAQLWLNYSSMATSQDVVGATSLLIDNNQLLLNVSDFGSSPSYLDSFGIDSTTGTFTGASNVVLSDASGTLGQLQINSGNLLISDTNQIYQIEAIPEPSTLFLFVLGVAGLIGFHVRRARRLVPAVALIASSVFFSIGPAKAGPFSPAADQPGSTGISGTSTFIQEWANSVVTFAPGPVNITNPTGAKASFGTPSNALGPSDSTQTNPNNVVSLGDGGSITLSFAQPITNGPGADFAVYENGFPESGVPNAYFLELATVAVSSNGVNFFTFPSVSLTQTTTQVGGFGTLDPTNLYNLAGSEIVGYGTPFNLDDLAGVSPLLNINDITQVRVTDVIGNINTTLGPGTYTTDDASNPIFNGAYGTTNHLINDPYPTPFNSGGFDLDAIGVLNTLTVPEPSMIWYLVFGLGAIMIISRCLRPRPIRA